MLSHILGLIPQNYSLPLSPHEMLLLPCPARFQAFNLITYSGSAPRPWEAMPLHPARKDPLGKINHLPWCHAIKSQQKQQSTASLVLPLSSTHAGRRVYCCHCHWPNKPCSKCEAHLDFPILPHHHFQQILIPLHPEPSDGSLCSSLVSPRRLWCWDASGQLDPAAKLQERSIPIFFP